MSSDLKNKVIVFSHGMGVGRDNRGLFTEISQRVEDMGATTYLFDYNKIDEIARTMEVLPFSEQALLLQDTIDHAHEAHPGAEIVIIAQSQGCLIPALCDMSHVKHVINIAPFFHTNMQDVLRRYTSSPENVVDFTGVSIRKRTDGTTTIIPASYWRERFSTDVVALYNNLAQRVLLTLISALQDEVMDNIELRQIKYARIINTDGNHDFTAQYRPILLDIIVKELVG